MMFFVGLLLIVCGYMINGALTTFLMKKYQKENTARGNALFQEFNYFNAWLNNLARNKGKK